MIPVDEMQRFSFVAAESDAGERLDRFLADRMPDTSRARVKSLIKQGHAASAGCTILEPNARVKPGAVYDITVPPPQSPIPRPEPIPLDVVYEDDHLIVIDKPAGMVVHPAAGNWSGTLVNALIAHCGNTLSGIGGVRRPGIVHRLDKDTSGLMVVAKTDVAHRALAKQFADHGRTGPLRREYLALVWGVPHPPAGTIDAAIGRKSDNRQKMAVVTSGGKPAVTHYEVKETYSGPETRDVASAVTCRLETGRTHQIRVHMARIGHPLLGDTVYGAGFKTKAKLLPEPAREALSKLGRQALHAHLLGFRHPITGETLCFERPPPQAMSNLLKYLTDHR